MHRRTKKAKSIARHSLFASPLSAQDQRDRLFKALLTIGQFQQKEDFFSLQNPSFLKLCGLEWISWELASGSLKLLPAPSRFKEPAPPVQFSCPLKRENSSYGNLLFFSSQGFSKSKKAFCETIAFYSSCALYFIEKGEKAKAVERDWGGAFDSFSQAFCITDKSFKVILFNHLFQKLGEQTEDLIGKNFFKFLSIPPTIPETEPVWLAKGKKQEEREFCLEISRKPLFLKREKIQTFLFLIKDVTQELRLEEQLSRQAKERELGLIKAGIAHELNNPLAGIKILLNIMEKKLSSNSSLCKNSLMEMSRAVDRCSALVSDLLSASSKIKKLEPKRDSKIT